MSTIGAPWFAADSMPSHDSFLGFAPLLTLVSAVVGVGILSVYVASADRIERDIATFAESDEDVPSAASGAEGATLTKTARP